ncbi:unnamed protein product [Mytilus edulis]|uniref:Uncharacterized protein n=1 Tax=Mytilus edulis TaxID=6550 RepID=A0A8S3T1W8_MYTED|nr:unnamed protein product [Mytilus edulis]
MEIARRRSDRVKGKKVMFTPCKTVSNTATKNKKSNSNSSINEKTVDYELNKRKAVSKKLDAAERLYTVKTEISPGNLVLIFSAAAYEEFKVITQSVVNNTGLQINKTETKDKLGAIVSESLAIHNGSTKLFVLNFFNTTTKVLLNGNQSYIKEFITTALGDILCILDYNTQQSNLDTASKDEQGVQILSKKSMVSSKQQTVGTCSNIKSKTIQSDILCPTCKKVCGNDSKAVDRVYLYKLQQLRALQADCVAGGSISDNSNDSNKGEEMPRSSLSSADINPMAGGSVVSGVTIIHKDNRLFSNNNSTNDEDINKDNSRSDSSYSSVQMGSNILKEEIISLKLEITHKDKGIKQKDSQIYKLQTEVSTQKKSLQQVEQDEANGIEICKQDNKISNLSDKLLDLRFDNNNQSTRSRQRQNRGRQNNANKYSRNERSQFDRHSENKHCKFQNDFADFSGGMSFRHDESQPNSLHIDTSGSENETNSVVNGQTNNSDNFLGNIHSRGKSKCQTQARKRFHEKSEQIYIPQESK